MRHLRPSFIITELLPLYICFRIRRVRIYITLMRCWNYRWLLYILYQYILKPICWSIIIRKLQQQQQQQPLQYTLKWTITSIAHYEQGVKLHWKACNLYLPQHFVVESHGQLSDTHINGSLEKATWAAFQRQEKIPN